ncbi:unnamed protein product, partial [marine sediment metagenome]
LSTRFALAGYKNYIVNHLIYHMQGASYKGSNEALRRDMELGEDYYNRKWFRG